MQYIDFNREFVFFRLLSIVMLNSVLAMSGAGLGTLFLSRLIVKQWSVYRVIGGMLAGEL